MMMTSYVVLALFSSLTAKDLLDRCIAYHDPHGRFLYLYGLPMKLRDPGTRLDPRVKETSFQGKPAYELRVTYDKSVGTDTWYFYLDRKTCALIGHRFHHDEAAGDGEYTVLSDEISGEGLTLPRVRKWYRNQGNEFFITHTILSIR